MPPNAPKLRCHIIVPESTVAEGVARALRRGAKAAGFEVPPPPPLTIDPLGEEGLRELVQSDCVLADITDSAPNVMFELGVAQSTGKPVFAFFQEGHTPNVPYDIRDYIVGKYSASKTGLEKLAGLAEQTLSNFKRSPGRARRRVAGRGGAPFFLEWERLDGREKENLCRELLMQLGYRQVEWAKRNREVDLVAELPKKDPDGFEYRELWLIAIMRKGSVEFIEGLIGDPDYVVHMLLRERSEVVARDSRPLTALLVDLDDALLPEVRERIERRMRRRRAVGQQIRLRIWTRDFVAQLLQQFPQLAFKYFSEEGQARDRHRKSLDELYRENITLSEKQGALIKALEEERTRRITAERDAAWKDISFAAAHKLGNPIFAIETNLDPLLRRIRERRIQEAIEVVGEIGVSVEKAKDIVDQFKSLARVHEMQPNAALLFPIFQHSCASARKRGIDCVVECPPTLDALVDENRVGECFDELVANATWWLDKTEKKIIIKAGPADGAALPAGLDSSRNYVRVLVCDNGQGVAVDNKGRIFDAFFTTRDQGTGLGLALVRKVIEAHGGAISEIGNPQEGAVFEVFLPRPESSGVKPGGPVSEKRKATA